MYNVIDINGEETSANTAKFHVMHVGDSLFYKLDTLRFFGDDIIFWAGY